MGMRHYVSDKEADQFQKDWDAENRAGWGNNSRSRNRNRNKTATPSGDKQMSTQTKPKNEKILTPLFRVSFPTVNEPKSLNGGPLKYSLVMLFPKGTDLSKLETAVLAAIHGKWGTDKTKWPELRSPFRKGTEKQYDGYDDDLVFISASSKNKPGLVDNRKQRIIDPGEFYGGCWAHATVNAFAYDKMGNKGVSFGLQNIIKMKDGDHFGGKVKAEDDFDGIEMPQEGAGDETGGGSDNGLGDLV